MCFKATENESVSSTPFTKPNMSEENLDISEVDLKSIEYLKKIEILSSDINNYVDLLNIIKNRILRLRGSLFKANGTTGNFEILKNIQLGDKIGKIFENNEEENKDILYFIKGEYCIYNNSHFQKLSRWWYNENYEKTFNYIDNDFSLFAKYLDNLKNIILIDGKILYKKLTLEIVEFSNEIIKGLYNLKQTYENNTKIKAKIDSIIMILLDFKNENT